MVSRTKFHTRTKLRTKTILPRQHSLHPYFRITTYMVRSGNLVLSHLKMMQTNEADAIISNSINVENDFFRRMRLILLMLEQRHGTSLSFVTVGNEERSSYNQYYDCPQRLTMMIYNYNLFTDRFGMNLFCQRFRRANANTEVFCRPQRAASLDRFKMK